MGWFIIVGVLALLSGTAAVIVRGIASGKAADAQALQMRSVRHSAGPVAGLVIRPLAAADRTEWQHHWESYTSFYGQDLPPFVTDTTWSRIIDLNAPVKGWGAFDPSGNLLGFVHVVLHLHTWSPKTLCYLEDLFVAQPFRGRDIGHSLIQFVWRLAEERGWGRVYWHTESGNAPARRLYDRFRPADAYVRYTLTL